MTDGGTFLLYDGPMYKLGSCGLEEIASSLERVGGNICGKVPGGALFCGQGGCNRYDDASEDFETMPPLNESSFPISIHFFSRYC